MKSLNALPPVAVLQIDGIESMPEYGPQDVAHALATRNIPCREVGQAELEAGLSRNEVLVVCFLRGDFPEKAVDALSRFHAAGGSLLFLGQLPFKKSWAPTRNFYADRLHLTAYGVTGRVDNWSEAAYRLLGNGLPSLEPFYGKPFGCARTTAFPPDETEPLFTVSDKNLQWEALPGVFVRRCGAPFLGAKLAQLGCTGGEPRENAAGGYVRPWTHDPGFLTRDWPGMDELLIRLLRALKPEPFAAALTGDPVQREDERVPLKLLLRNAGDTEWQTDALHVCGTDVDLTLPTFTLAPGEWRTYPLALPAANPGIRTLTLQNSERVLHRFQEHILPASAPNLPLGYGFSTYWCFHRPAVPDTFKYFCQTMKARGCCYVRVNIPWEDIEPAPGEYDWRVPDAYLDCAAELGLTLLFWMFPITRGSTIGDGGVPAWTLREPAIARDGTPGLFPSLWSPFYRKHFLNMVDAFTRRYAKAEQLNRFVIDFGNSDFPYGYFYYVNDPTLFDYSEHERAALAEYLVQQRGFSIEQIGALYGTSFKGAADIPVPLAEKHPEAWRVYLDFRAWSIRQGLEAVRSIVARNAPNKLPPDLPGHGSGSIADLNTYHLDAKARHWTEEQSEPAALTGLHNAGPSWGGEPWQVGSRYVDFDDALFQSIRLGADYFSIAGPDIGVYGADLARAGFVRRWLQGAEREPARIAVIDNWKWDAFQSLAHVAARLDQPVDLLGPRHRHDPGGYDLLVLPSNELTGSTSTGGGGGSLLPADAAWGEKLRTAVEHGLQVLLFPGTARLRQGLPPHTYVRQALELCDVDYGPRVHCALRFPNSFGGGETSGHARAVHADGEVLLRDTEMHPLLVRRTLGQGAVWLAGWDTDADSIDGARSPGETNSIERHTLVRFIRHLGIEPPRVRSQQAYLYKEWIKNTTGEALLLFSHYRTPRELNVEIKLDRPSGQAMDLATGEKVPVHLQANGWHRLQITIQPETGRYLWFNPHFASTSDHSG